MREVSRVIPEGQSGGVTEVGFSSYDISDDDWDSELDCPWPVMVGSGLAYHPGLDRIYLTKGGGTTFFSCYSWHDNDDDDDGGQGDVVGTDTWQGLTARTLGHGEYVLSCPDAAGRDAVFTAFDAQGRKVWQATSNSGTQVWNTGSNVASGAYIARVEAPGCRAVTRVVVIGQ